MKKLILALVGLMMVALSGCYPQPPMFDYAPNPAVKITGWAQICGHGTQQWDQGYFVVVKTDRKVYGVYLDGKLMTEETNRWAKHGTMIGFTEGETHEVLVDSPEGDVRRMVRFYSVPPNHC